MRETAAGKRAARQCVEAKLATMTNAQLRERTADSGPTPLDPGTIGDFLNGARWPRRSTLARIELALGIEPGTLGMLAREEIEPARLDPEPERPKLSDAEFRVELERRLRGTGT